MSHDGPFLSVIIPAYREAERIGDSILAVTKHFQSLPGGFEVIVSDDGSDDETRQIVTSIAAADPRVSLVRLKTHRGKGAAVRAGILAARGTRVLVADADLAIPLSQYEVLAKALDAGAHVAVASKELGRRNGMVTEPFMRMLLGRVFNLAVRLIALNGISDTQAGFKLFAGDAARQLAARCVLDGFAYDVEMLVLALHQGFVVAEVPVACSRRARTSVRLLSDSLKMLLDLLEIRRRLGYASKSF